MPELDYNYQIHEKAFQHEADKALLVKFFVKPFKDETASAAQGVPVFVDKEYIDIKATGTHVCRPVTGRDIDRFPEHYRLFKARTSTEGVVGTLLTEWPRVTRSEAEQLAFFNVKTVEQLANMADTHSGKLMNFYALKQDAQKWLEAAKEQNAAVHLKEELAKRDAEIEELKAAMAQLIGKAQEIKAAPCGPKKKGGRPKKKVVQPKVFAPKFENVTQ